jgi:hypothetical protein
MRKILSYFITLLAGVTLGGYLFADSVKRSFLAVGECDTQCSEIKDLAGLLASAGILRTPSLLPFLVSQSKECIAVKHPKPEGRFHLVFLPKRDVRNVMELTAEDVPYLTGCLALARKEVAKASIDNYRLVSNGPSLQHVTYFHFHVIAK